MSEGEEEYKYANIPGKKWRECRSAPQREGVWGKGGGGGGIRVREEERQWWRIMVLYFPGEAQNIAFSDPVMGANHSSTMRICIFVSANLLFFLSFLSELLTLLTAHIPV